MKTQKIVDRPRGAFDVTATWIRLVCNVIARFARGNISAQHGRILFPAQQDEQRKRAVKVAQKMSHRKKAA